MTSISAPYFASNYSPQAMVSVHPFPHPLLIDRPTQKLLKTAATAARHKKTSGQHKGFFKNLLQVIFFTASKRSRPRGSSGESLYWDNIWHWLTSCMQDSLGKLNDGHLTISLHNVQDACYSYVWQHLPKACSKPKRHQTQAKRSSIQQLDCTSERLLINTTITLCL